MKRRGETIRFWREAGYMKPRERAAAAIVASMAHNCKKAATQKCFRCKTKNLRRKVVVNVRVLRSRAIKVATSSSFAAFKFMRQLLGAEAEA